MSEITDTAGTSDDRTFHSSDYQRFSSIVKAARSQHGDATADAMLAVMLPVLHVDAPDSFDAERFSLATYRLPAHIGELARALKQARHVKGQPWTAKAPEHQATVDESAAMPQPEPAWHVVNGAGGDDGEELHDGNDLDDRHDAGGGTA